MKSRGVRNLFMVLPPLLLVLIWSLRELARVGVQLFLSQSLPLLLQIGLFLAGWVLGWSLVNLDKWIEGLRLSGPVGEAMSSWKSSVRNGVTLSVLVVVGFWLVTSSQSVLGWGTVLGVQARLLAELVSDQNIDSWYSVLARKISPREHTGAILLFIVLLIIQFLLLVNAA